jgi:hypothetical protein
LNFTGAKPLSGAGESLVPRALSILALLAAAAILWQFSPEANACGARDCVHAAGFAARGAAFSEAFPCPPQECHFKVRTVKADSLALPGVKRVSGGQDDPRGSAAFVPAAALDTPGQAHRDTALSAVIPGRRDLTILFHRFRN